MPGWSQAAALAALDKLIADYPYTKLHIGDPGAAGTANPAVNTARVLGAWSAAAGSTKANSAEMLWSSAPAAEDPTHFSQWSSAGPAGGNFGASGLITSNALAIGDDARFAPGTLVLTAQNVAA